MADKEQKIQNLEREYTIPLRKFWLKKPKYKRTGIAVKTLKQFIAKHMKVPERDLSKVKLDTYLNNDLWFRGIERPLSRVKVKAIKEGDIVKVTFAEEPTIVRFEKAKHERRHKPQEVKEKAKPSEEKKPVEKEIKEEQKEAEKKDEKEKEQSVADTRQKQAEQQAKAQKHLTSVKEPSHHRMAMKK